MVDSGTYLRGEFPKEVICVDSVLKNLTRQT